MIKLFFCVYFCIAFINYLTHIFFMYVKENHKDLIEELEDSEKDLVLSYETRWKDKAIKGGFLISVVITFVCWITGVV